MIVHVTDMALAERMWPTLEPMIKRVTDTTHGCYEPQDVFDAIKSGQKQLWVSWDDDALKVDAVMFTSIAQYPRKRSLYVSGIAGGGMRKWISDFIVEIEKFAAREGADFIEGSFRRGWLRVWPGVKEHGITMYKDVAA